MTTEQIEAEAAKAAETDAAAMDKLMAETLDAQPPPPTDEPPPPEPKTEETPPPEPKAEPPSPEPKAEPVTAKPKDTPAELDDFQKDLASSKYDLPAGSTRHAKELNKILKGHADDQHKLYLGERTARETLAKEIDQLKAQVAQGTKDREELDRFRPIVETLAIEQNPNLNARYNAEMSQINSRLMQTLRAGRLPKETADYIMENGGPAYFSKDSVSQVEAEPEYEGGPAIKMSHKEFWEKRVVGELNNESKDSIRLAFDDALRVREARDAQLRTALSNREEYFKNLEAESKKQETAFKAACQKQLDTKLKDLGDIAKERPVPADATPEQKQRIESYNAVIKDATAKFDPYFLNTAPEALVNKALGGLLLDAMPKLLELEKAETAFWKEKHDALQKKWDTTKRASNTSNRQSVQQQP